ncbi:MAG: cupin domain-containing protein [Gammaproteobacteria bacterium]|nr:cupin domain-containing protein [Gammaproteobacteria bacterium]MCY3792754.1 cupin domain-containing protein [Gammaproteobacteria bacterium]
MKNVTASIILGAAVFAAPLAAVAGEEGAVMPAKINKEELAGSLFERDDTTETVHEDGHRTLDVTTLLSSDGKFASGMYRSDKVRIEIKEPYGVDEFMYFLEGGVTLTSADGTVQTIEAGEAVTIPREWTGTFDTDGYSKIWVIYSADGSGL